jgi:integrase
MSQQSQRGSTRKRGNTWTAIWHVRDAEGVRWQRNKGGFRTKADAVEYLDLQLGKLRAGTYTEPEKLTLTEFVRRHFLPRVADENRDSTAEQYADVLEGRVLPRIGGLRLTAIDRGTLYQLRKDLLESGARGPNGGGPLSPRTVNLTMSIVGKVLGDALEDDLIAKNPAKGMKKVKEGHTEMKVWNAEQTRAYLDAIGDDRLAALWSLYVRIGLRRGEALALRWSDVDLDKRTLRIEQTLVLVSAPKERGGRRLEWSEPKTEAGRRTITLGEDLAAELRRHRQRQREERMAWGEAYELSDLVFTRENGAAIHPETASFWHSRWCRIAGLPVIRLHDLRHTAATLALSAGVHPKTVSVRLGHKKVGVTLDVYSHVLDEHQDEAAEAVDDLLRRPAQGER